MVRMCKTGSRLFGVCWKCYVVVGFLMLQGVHLQESYNEETRLTNSHQRPKILSLHISSDIKYRFATTLVVSRVKNPYKVAQEVMFDVTLPNEAFITDFKLEMNGTVYDAEIKEKEQAKTQYETAKSRGESAAHIKERPRETNKFDIQVNVAAESEVTFNLTYQELLRRKRGLYHHVVYIDPGQPVQDMSVRIHIQESRNISVVRVPALRNDINEIKGIATNNLVFITRPSPNTAFIQFAPTIQQQIDNDQNGISGQFVVEYDIERSRDAGEILVVNGYFVHFFAPSGFKPFPKDVLFIVDESGSMSGRKMDQVKEAMTTILSDLQEVDRMNIMTFSTDINIWKNEVVKCTKENIFEAKFFITGRKADGGTNINKALLDGIKHLLKLEKSEFRTPMIVFLTDGDATVGETNSKIILENIKNENQKGVIPIFTLAFGEDADYDLLKNISSRNYGVARKIYEASDANLQITGFYEEISSALMTDLVFQYLDGSVDNTTITESHFRHYFDGSEMVVAGKTSEEETKTVPLKVIGNSLEGSTVLNFNSAVLAFGDFINMTTLASIENITEKVWAYLTIKQIVEKLNAADDGAVKKSLKASALALSLKYKFVTPLTSMVVTKPDTQGEATRNLNYSASFQDDMKSSSSLGNALSLKAAPLGYAPSLMATPLFQTAQASAVAKSIFQDVVDDPSLQWIRRSFVDHYDVTAVAKLSSEGPKMYPIRIKYNNASYATCFSIPNNGSYKLQLLHSQDGIEINADLGDRAEGDHIVSINVTVNSTLLEINTADISILEVNKSHIYYWGSHDLLLPDVKVHVEPSTVKVEVDGLSFLINKIGNSSKGLGLFMNETTFQLDSSATGLLATLAGGRSSPSGITILGHAAVFTAYTLTDLSETDAWHGDSKCYTVQSEDVSKISP